MHFIDAKQILSSKNGMNVYRGCTHGCIYCDSRSKCYHIDHAFEDIAVKQNAPLLLENSLIRKRKKCMISSGSMCDPYMHCEKELRITQQCLQIIEKHNFGVALLTKSDTILRDLDLICAINNKSKAVVQMTLTTFDENLCKIIEPNVSTTAERYRALKVFEKNDVPTIVWLCPLLPFINDDEKNFCSILDYCFDANVKGIVNFGIGLTLREGNREFFYDKLDKHFPGIKNKYQKKYGYSYEIASDNSGKLMKIFYERCQKYGVMSNIKQIFTYLSQYPQQSTGYEQLSLF